ncbi:transposase [Streptomyces decoyicus]|uniref:transposase n=1 Tax=Streptomyces decoyicus TaxID=249567 RepID=UPI00363E5EE4
MGRIAGRFVRVEPWRRARSFVLGLLSDLPRKNCWTLAEHARDTTPYGLQHLLSRARWDADAVRADIRGLVVAPAPPRRRAGRARGRRPEDGHAHGGSAAPVHRHRRRIENCQVAVYLAYSTPLGHAAIDRSSRGGYRHLPGTHQLGFAAGQRLRVRCLRTGRIGGAIRSQGEGSCDGGDALPNCLSRVTAGQR